MAAIVDSYDAVLLDLDGVLHRGARPIPGAAESVAALRSRGARPVFVTNNASRTPGQVVAHLAPHECGAVTTNAVDGDNVPVRHFGVVLTMQQWDALADKLKRAGTKFVIEPHIRFKGQVGEQATMFFLDPCGNALEFKAFKDMGSLFAK